MPRGDGRTVRSIRTLLPETQARTLAKEAEEMARRKRRLTTIRKGEGDIVLCLKGNLDGSAACEVEETFHQLRGPTDGCRLTLDLSGLRGFEHFSLTMLANSIRRQRRRFREVRLTGVKPQAERLFSRLGV
jgi:anti-anti-sigma factor